MTLHFFYEFFPYRNTPVSRNAATNSACVRSPFVELHAPHNNCRLSGSSVPPFDRGLPPNAAGTLRVIVRAEVAETDAGARIPAAEIVFGPIVFSTLVNVSFRVGARGVQFFCRRDLLIATFRVNPTKTLKLNSPEWVPLKLVILGSFDV